ncbi:hypothetical protein JTE90_019665, partial [Oedothorax gibbosus]
LSEGIQVLSVNTFPKVSLRLCSPNKVVELGESVIPKEAIGRAIPKEAIRFEELNINPDVLIAFISHRYFYVTDDVIRLIRGFIQRFRLDVSYR